MDTVYILCHPADFEEVRTIMRRNNIACIITLDEEHLKPKQVAIIQTLASVTAWEQPRRY